MSHNTYWRGGTGSHNTYKSAATVTDADAELANCGFDLALYKTNVVAVRKLCLSPLKITRSVQLELKAMCSLSHDNVNAFIGICARGDVNNTVTKFCSKGSLRDILENDDIKLDNNFKVSLISDLIRGMHFLHQSEIKCHGRLRSSKCVVDGRWVLQVTDWGITHLRSHEYESEEARNRALFWTAPEQLRSSEEYSATPMADVYSFGIIFYETMYRMGPFTMNGELSTSAEDVIARVRYGERPPFRPRIPTTNQQRSEYIDLMLDCWHEKPSERPEFAVIKKRFKDMNSGIKYNIVDNMLRMMEKYTNDLEAIVDDRTKQLTEEIKKTDILLYKMMPPYVDGFDRCHILLNQRVNPSHYFVRDFLNIK
ncbi:Resact receptor [Lamellibrachia satsuma]|nr:Resact receptor [Lamellibrachia satsuma]